MWWIEPWDLLIQTSVVVAIVVVLIGEGRRYRRATVQVRGKPPLGEVVLAAILVLNGCALGAMFLQYEYLGRRAMQPDARQKAVVKPEPGGVVRQ
jgi:hypothetical protein